MIKTSLDNSFISFNIKINLFRSAAKNKKRRTGSSTTTTTTTKGYNGGGYGREEFGQKVF